MPARTPKQDTVATAEQTPEQTPDTGTSSEQTPDVTAEQVNALESAIEQTPNVIEQTPEQIDVGAEAELEETPDSQRIFDDHPSVGRFMLPNGALVTVQRERFPLGRTDGKTHGLPQVAIIRVSGSGSKARQSVKRFDVLEVRDAIRALEAHGVKVV